MGPSSAPTAKISDVAATQVPLQFKEAKLREKMSFHSRESVLKISKRVLNVHALDGDSFKRLENLISPPSQSPRDTIVSEEFEQMKAYNPGILEYPACP